MEEIWKEILGFEDYKVSTLGRVMNKNGKILLPNKGDKNGYIRQHLTNNGKHTVKKTHRLVAEAFIPNPENKKEVNHIDGNKKNNSVENLEWNTSSENHQHAFDIGLRKDVGENHLKSKLTKKHVSEIRALKGIKTNREISIAYGVSMGLISNILNNKIWKH